MTAQEHAQRPREYGGWRRRRGIGLWGLGAAGTLTVLAAAVITMLVGALDARLLVFTLPPVLLAGGLGLTTAASSGLPRGLGR